MLALGRLQSLDVAVDFVSRDEGLRVFNRSGNSPTALASTSNRTFPRRRSLVTYIVEYNRTEGQRSGTITVAGQLFVVFDWLRD